MNKSGYALRFGLALGLALLVSAPVPSVWAADAADTPPEKPVGLSGTADSLGEVDLAPHNIPGITGDYVLRARLITVAPGGAVNQHAHLGRPGIVRIIKGTIIEYRGGTSHTYKAGDYWLETADTVHWFRNPSTTEPAEIWAVDLVAKKK